MIEGFISMDLFHDESELKRVSEAAKKDAHGLFLPTHILRKSVDPKIEPVGYMSIGNPGAVITFAWLSTLDIKPRESFHLVNMAENLVKLGKQRFMCWPVPKTSPFHPLMGHLGYKNCGAYDFFVKDLAPHLSNTEVKK